MCRLVPHGCDWCMCTCAHRVIHVCRWSEEKSTAGVALISGVILSFSPQGHVAETRCLARPEQADTQQAAKVWWIHAGLDHTVWNMVSYFRLPHPTPLISPHSFLFSWIISALIAASSTIYTFNWIDWGRKTDRRRIDATVPCPHVTADCFSLFFSVVPTSTVVRLWYHHN